MSIDVNWHTLTGGPEGAALAESVRSFVHNKFQEIPLPRFIRSVKVHTFDFGKVPPEIEIKDICDPLPDFYEEDEDDDTENGDEGHDQASHAGVTGSSTTQPPSLADPHARHLGGEALRPNSKPTNHSLDRHARSGNSRAGFSPIDRVASPPPFLPRAPTPGLMGGASNLGYFHMPFTTGLSGTTTPLAAVAGAQFHPGRTSTQQQQHSKYQEFHPQSSRVQTNSSAPGSTSSTADPNSRPPSQHLHGYDLDSRSGLDGANFGSEAFETPMPDEGTPLHEPDANDIQVITHIKYSGDIKLGITASILLDYPMPSFVEIPVKLNITGITFDGIAILAHIRKKAHFCFLSPEDAETLITNEASSRLDHLPGQRQLAGGLLEQIRVESEIGQKDEGKQVLKNVGKVESFILEQVRRIFEEEFVYPSFWTLLV